MIDKESQTPWKLCRCIQTEVEENATCVQVNKSTEIVETLIDSMNVIIFSLYHEKQTEDGKECKKQEPSQDLKIHSSYVNKEQDYKLFSKSTNIQM